MFDCQVGGPDAAATLSLVSDTHRLVRHQECKLVELAAHWSDLNHPDSQAPAGKTLPGVSRAGSWAGTEHRRCWSSPRPNSALRWKPATDRPVR
jgi:hypothetical protein